jgi:hypothetical protein
MALIDLSDWLDRFGAESTRAAAPSELEAIRIVAHETAPSHAPHKVAAAPALRLRWRRMWRRAFQRLRRPGNAT